MRLVAQKIQGLPGVTFDDATDRIVAKTFDGKEKTLLISTLTAARIDGKKLDGWHFLDEFTVADLIMHLPRQHE